MTDVHSISNCWNDLRPVNIGSDWSNLVSTATFHYQLSLEHATDDDDDVVVVVVLLAFVVTCRTSTEQLENVSPFLFVSEGDINNARRNSRRHTCTCVPQQKDTCSSRRKLSDDDRLPALMVPRRAVMLSCGAMGTSVTVCAEGWSWLQKGDVALLCKRDSRWANITD